MSPLYNYILQTAIAISVFYIVYWLLLRKETFFGFNRYFFLVSIGFALLLPFGNLGHLSLFQENGTVHAVARGYHSLQNMIVIHPVNSPEEVPVKFSLIQYFVNLYILGVVFFLLRLVLQTGILFLRIQKARIVSIFESRVVLDGKVNSPFSFFSWIFLNPAQIEEQNLPDIILHEKEHIRQKHIFDLFLIELICAFQWINPFVWLLRKAIKETHEYLADHAVIRKGVPVGDYQKLLLSYALGAGHPALITPLNFSLNKKRMIMMRKTKSPDTRKWRSLFLLPIILIMSLAFTNPFNAGTEMSTANSKDTQFIPDTGKTMESVELYILNGKQFSVDQFKILKIDPATIQSVKAINGKDALKKYGEKAKNGVLVITTKELPKDRNQQKYTVTGKVLNNETGDPMPGVNIVIMNTTMGTVSDPKGKFSLQIDKESVEVAFSFVGFKTRVTDVKNGDDIIVRLHKKVTELNLISEPKLPENKVVQPDHPAKRNTTDEIFFVVEDMPRYPGGKQALSKYISSHINYPPKARNENRSGTVMVTFTIDEEGNVKNVHVDKNKGKYPDLDQEAVRVISGMPKWEPAVQRGKAVPVELSLPVKFKI
ncbi:MAG: TonB family protein [Chlorobi bacterium]|nr:TonB family protein [Chlorobiota bacterium]